MIVEGRIINSDSDSHGQILIGPSGRIEKLGPRLGEPDLKTPGLIFPGFVDVHVHAREDTSGTQTYKEDYRSMSEAAIHGGVIAVADMPNNRVVPVSEELYRAKAALTKSALVDVLIYGAIVPGSKPLPMAVPYKVYMGHSVGDVFFTSFAELKETVTDYHGRQVSFHCEDPKILGEHERETTHEGQRPREAEISAVKFAIALAAEYNILAKLSHVSTAEAVDLIARAKSQRAMVTAEVAPHHLFFDETNINDSQRRFLQVNPPLRLPRDREVLLSALKHGTIDFLASDHAPHTIAEKMEGISGIPHLDTFGAFATWLIREQNFTPQDIARVCAENPGKFVSEFLPDKFGRIEKGYVGSLTIIDPETPHTIRRQDLKTKCGWSPFEGVTFPGQVTHTIVKGKIYAW